MPPLFYAQYGILSFVTASKPPLPTCTVDSPSRRRHNRIRCSRYRLSSLTSTASKPPLPPGKVDSPSRRRHNRIRCSRYRLSSLTSNAGLSTCSTTSSNRKKTRRSLHNRDRRHHHRSRHPHHNSGSDDFCAEETYWTRFLPSSKKVDLDPLVCGRPSFPLRHRRRMSLG